MKKRILAVSLGLAFVSTISRSQPAQGLGERIEAGIQQREPLWKPAVGVQSGHIPLTPSEKPVLISEWSYSKSHGRLFIVNLNIYSISSSREAADWVQAGQPDPKSWISEAAKIGDGGVISSPKGKRFFSLEFRRGKFVVAVSGDEFLYVKRFGQEALKQIDAI